MKHLLIFLGLALTPLIFAQRGERCAPDNLTLDEKLTLNGYANDHDNNSVVTYSDIEFDLSNNYDTNDDGQTSEAEWVARWTCAFADDEFFARFVYAILSKGAPIVTTDFNTPPFNTTGIPLDNFLATNRARYDLFNTSHCVDTTLTVEQKLARIAHDNDHNNDSKVTTSDIAYDLSHYDTNNDGLVTKDEWVVRWVCAYGDTVAYAAYVWNAVTRGADSVSSNQFTGEPFRTGIPIENFKATNRKRYEDYAAATPIGK